MESMTMAPKSRVEKTPGEETVANLSKMETITQEQIEKGDPAMLTKIKNGILDVGNAIMLSGLATTIYGAATSNWEHIQANISDEGAGTGEKLMTVGFVVMAGGLLKKAHEWGGKQLEEAKAKRAMKMAGAN